MGKWAVFPHAGEFDLDEAQVRRMWPRLHASDAEPLPQDPAALAAWCHFHRGEYQQAAESGLKAGSAGIARPISMASCESTGGTSQGRAKALSRDRLPHIRAQSSPVSTSSPSVPPWRTRASSVS